MGTPIGTGIIQRLKVNRYEYQIENQYADAKTAECVRDKQSGAASGAEAFTFRGASPAREFPPLLIEGSGAVGEVVGVTGSDSEQVMTNPSFGQWSGTNDDPTQLTNLPGWAVGTSLANFNIELASADPDNIYRTYSSEQAAPAGISFIANDTLTQSFAERAACKETTVPQHNVGPRRIVLGRA